MRKRLARLVVAALVVSSLCSAQTPNDAMRGVDYLSNRKDIDASRSGAFGCSGGGTMTISEQDFRTLLSLVFQSEQRLGSKDRINFATERPDGALPLD